jgi:group 2 glycosyl transferase
MSPISEKVSGLIITYNEEKNIKEVLPCFDFCDEIIIVDSFSTDSTVAIAQSFPKVKVIQHKFEDFASQRNVALQHAQNDWVLFLDGDERITPGLRSEIIQTLNRTDKKDAYYFRRLFFFAGKPIHFSGTQGDKNFRLFRKSKCHYIPERKVHETLAVEGSIGVLKHKLLHYSVADYASYRQKAILYGKFKGEEMLHKGKRYSALKMYAKMAFHFFKTYVLKLGFLDGKEGFLLSKVDALSVYENFTSLKKYQQSHTL